MKNCMLILDFGSQCTHLIKARLADLGIRSIIEPGDITCVEFKKKHLDFEIKGLILSGGSQSVYKTTIRFDEKWINVGVPVLGVCYGHQLLAKMFGGTVRVGEPEFGKEDLSILGNSPLLDGLRSRITVWMSHSDSISKLPEQFLSDAKTTSNSHVVISNQLKNIYGVQFHPEVSHTPKGLDILRNFAVKICKIKPGSKWTPQRFVKEATEKYKFIIGKEKVILGLSGGVDSSTMAAVLRKIFPKNQLIAVYIDSGLMPDETMQEVKEFCKSLDLKLLVRDSSDLFFKKLNTATHPTEKGKIIGELFIREFEQVAKGNYAKFFSQGTIWSDVVESGVTKFSSQIKPHHNVGGLPKKMDFQLIEPLRDLFKDQVRAVAKHLKLPKDVVQKKVFPGPGFAIRVDGVVTKDKVRMAKQCTKIIEDVIYKCPISQDIWMAFAVLIQAFSLGVKGDKRIENDLAVVVRIIESQNSMTVNFSQKAYPYLEEISSRITRETNIGRVVYDITNKPPATIEWQ